MSDIAHPVDDAAQPADRASEQEMVTVLSELLLECLPGLCGDRVLLAELYASNACVGAWIPRVFGCDADPLQPEEEECATLPILRAIDQFGDALVEDGRDPFGLALVAAGVVRMTADIGAHALAIDLIERYAAGAGDALWPAWRDQALVVPDAAWVAAMPDSSTDLLVVSWRESDGGQHAFATSGYELATYGPGVGAAISDVILGDSAGELMTMLSTPVDGRRGLSFEQTSLDDAREVLTDGIADVRELAGIVAPADMPLPALTFLAHRRDLL